jgi:multidrug efflux pump subunit AcrB
LILRNAREILPPDLPFPSIQSGTTNKKDDPLLIYALNGPLPQDQLHKMAQDQFISSIGNHPMVDEIRLSTDFTSIVRVLYDPRKLESLEIDPHQIVHAINQCAETFDVTGFDGKGNPVEWTINGAPDQISDILRFPVNDEFNVGDLAGVKFGYERPVQISRFNGQHVLMLSVYSKPNLNKPYAASILRNRLESLRLSDSCSLTLSYDQSDFISIELEKIIQRASLSIIILCLFILLIYRDFHYLFMLISSILISVLITVLLLYLFRIQIHLYTIAALTISFGLVIDNSIITLDHLNSKSKTRITGALLAATVTSMIAVLVVFFIPEDESLALMDFSKGLTLSLLSSFLTASFFIPAIFRPSRSGRTTTQSPGRIFAEFYLAGLIFLRRKRIWAVCVLCLLFGIPIFLLPNKIQGFEGYNNFINSNWYRHEAEPMINGLLGGTFHLFHKNVYSRSNYRTPSKTELIVEVSLAHGHTIEQMDVVVQRLESQLTKFRGIKNLRSSFNSRYAQLRLDFPDSLEATVFPYLLKSYVIDQSNRYSGVEWKIYGVGRGYSNTSGEEIPSYNVKLKGPIYEELLQIANDLAVVLSRNRRVKNISINERINLEDENIEFYSLKQKPNINPLELDESLRIAQFEDLKTDYSGMIEIDGYTYPLVVESDDYQDFTMQKLMNTGGKRLLGDLIYLKKDTISNAIRRENFDYVMGFSFEYFGDFKFGENLIQEALQEYDFKPGYTYELDFWDSFLQKESRKYQLIPLIILMLFIALAILLNSLKYPLMIISIIPFSYIGIFLLFGLWRFSFDQGGFAAFILVAGVVVNATIFILNDVLQLDPKKWNTNV